MLISASWTSCPRMPPPSGRSSRVEHRSHKGLNNRAENSHLLLRKRKRMMQGLRSLGGLQQFTSVFSVGGNLFVRPRPSQSALATHLHRRQTVAAWKAAANVLA
jgi:putative transposase